VYEHRTSPLLPWAAFRRRLARHTVYALVLLVASLLLGTWGFWLFAGETPLDAFVNASMLLGGMGPIGEFMSVPGKWFAALFALYAGLAFLGVAAILFAPIFHRVLHKFHLEEQHRR
jgi:hypothetical protein